ncbi:unnamed protein product [Adineta steineri]|uniref:NAD(P)(+)--arginine ADP-ribosyltransferase n=1 Tax=Adineta steineri TaxID=433720 RepID=A0A814FT27_9BILA|nr:unnamed protein product [Adineta steineri]CAF0987935.1 unnamed protein product [Adineta steineri]CAF3846111.1 unnamed protein product [Adineta steineri]CAF3996803.1 unnamed protein product [Adineta steineri]
MALTRSGRFVDNYTSKRQQYNWNPISGYKDRAFKSLEEAVESIIPFVDNVMQYAEEAKQKCKKDTKLTINESSAIYLYTMDTPFYEKLNEILRAENPPALAPWFDFLKLFITALGKLPELPLRPTTVWRGVAHISCSNFCDKDMFTWWSVNSCSLDTNVAVMFSCEEGSLFCIHTINGKDISDYSSAKKGEVEEKEILLMPGTRLRVKSNTFGINDFRVVHLEEW